MTEDVVVSVSLQKGLETKTDLKQGVNGRLLKLENAVFTGVTDIEKRNGYTALPTDILNGGSVSTGNSLGSLNKTLQVFTGENVYTYSPVEDAFVDNGIKQAVNLTVDSLSGLIPTPMTFSAAPVAWPTEIVNGNIKFVVCGAPASISGYRASYFDTVKNVVISSVDVTSQVNIISVQSVKFNDQYVVCFTDNTGAYQVYTFSTDPTNPNPTQVLTGTGTSASTPTIITASLTSLYVANLSGSTITITAYDNTYTSVATVTATAGTTVGMDMFYDIINSELLFSYVYTSHVVANRYSSALTLLSNFYSNTDSGIASIFKTTVTTDGTNALVVYNSSVPQAEIVNITSVLNYRTTPTPTTVLPIGVGSDIYSSAFYLNGMFYVAAIYTSRYVNGFSIAEAVGTQSGIYLISLNPLDPTNYSIVGRAAYGSTFLSSGVFSPPVGVVRFSGLTLPYFSTISSSGTLAPQYNIKDFTLEFSAKLHNIGLAGNLNISGTNPSIFDGKGVAEAGFNMFPAITSGQFPSLGTTHSYSWVALARWIDFQGNVHRSAPSIPFVQTSNAPISGSNAIPLNVLGIGYSETYKVSDIYIDLYRTTDGGTVYFYDQTQLNSPGNSLTFTDSLVDSGTFSELIANQQLYTTGGEVDNIPPPAYHLLTEFKNRQIVVNDQDPLQWWFSKQVIEGFPVEFSDIFTQNIDQKGGPITALSTMDDKLIFFKESIIWYVFGDGPAPNGTNNDFTYPQLISSDTGCLNQDSIILTPNGLMFQSPKGIYLLSRQLQLSYIGSPVEAYNNFTVSSAQMISGTTQVRFTLLEIDTTLVYDYFVDQWSVFRNISAIDSIIYNGEFTYLGANGVVNSERTGSFLDNGDIIPMNFTTGWLKLNDIQGFERFKKMLLIGTSGGSSVINISFNYDYNPSFTRVISPIPVIAGQTRMQYRIFPSVQKCEAFQLVYTETPTTSSSGVTKVSNLALEIGLKKGPFKLPAAQSFG